MHTAGVEAEAVIRLLRDLCAAVGETMRPSMHMCTDMCSMCGVWCALCVCTACVCACCMQEHVVHMVLL